MRMLLLTISITAFLGPALRPASADDASADASHNQLTSEEKQAGWRSLFDGESTDGWRNYRSEGIGSGWKVIDGALVRAEGGAGDIVTEDQFDAFELSLEFRISAGGNSGVMYHVTETEPAPWMTGPEIQILDNARGRDSQKTGWLYQLYRPEQDASRPAGQWNHLRVLITPEKCEHYLNGVKYFEYVKGSEDWDERVARSKFAQYEDFGKAERGHICLQDHGDEVAFRNVKLRPIEQE